MILQCVTRKASGLPVTLLELHIAMHVVCALIMYLLWWDKPQDINEPFVLFDDVADACLYALASARILLEPAGPREIYQANKDNARSASPDGITAVFDKSPVGTGQEDAISEDGEELLVVYIRPRKDLNAPQEEDNEIDLSKHQDVIFDDMSPGSLIVSRVLKLSGSSGPAFRSNMTSWSIGRAELNVLSQIAQKYGSNVPSAFRVACQPQSPSLEEVYSAGFKNLLSSSLSIFLAVVIILIYGGCHVAAWNTHFPSAVEGWLWRVSSIVVAVAPCFVLVGDYFCDRGTAWDKFYITPGRPALGV